MRSGWRIQDFLPINAGRSGIAPTGKFLRDDGTWQAAGGGSGGLAATVTVTVPNNRIEHTETVTFTGCTGTKTVVVTLAPTVDTDENTAEMLDIAGVSATPGTDAATLTMAFREPTSGPIKFNLVAV
jgi:hypothetical protein